MNFQKRNQIATIVCYFVFLRGWSLASESTPDAPVKGNLTSRERKAVERSISDIIATKNNPKNIARLEKSHLKLSDCRKMDNGVTRCSYWDARHGNGTAISVMSLHIDSLNIEGDMGGSAYWQIRKDICISPKLMDAMGGTRVEENFLAGEPIAGELDSQDIVDYSLRDLNPAWGDVRARVTLVKDCLAGVRLDLTARNP